MDEREKTSCGSPFSLGDGSWTEAKDGEKRAYVPGVGVKGSGGPVLSVLWPWGVLGSGHMPFLS